MIEIKQKSACTGCSACYSVCPVGAIRMEPDKEGFLYPQAALASCVKCGRCVKICPKRGICQIQDIQQGSWGNEPQRDTMIRKQQEKAYAAYNKVEEERAISSSGGIFYALAQAVLADGGVVFGARFDNDFLAIHGKAETQEELISLIGSKYMQSRMGDCFCEVRKLLEKGREVLFVGTMCQVEGLLAILPETLCQKLYCIDLICMGVPSPFVWRTYQKALSRDGVIQHINFKNKIKGWQQFHLHIQYENEDVYQEGKRNSYMQTFFRGYNMRPSCFCCEYKSLPRKSDITLADCWGIEKLAADMNDNKGCSTVIVHTKKGQDLFERIQTRLLAREIPLENAIAGNRNYNECHKKPALRGMFWKIYRVCPYTAVCMFGNTIMLDGKQFLKRIGHMVTHRGRK